MESDRFPVVCFFFLLIHLASSSALPAFANETNPSYILQDVLKAISAIHKWKLQDVRVSKLDVGKVRFTTSHTYDFRIGLANKHTLHLKFLGQFESWTKFRKPKSDLPSLIHQLPLPVLPTLKIEGPLELHVHAPHQLSLSLPMNISYTGLKHVLVGEGITLDVRRAQEISFFYSSDLDLPWNGSTMFSNSKWKSDVWPCILQSTCMTLKSGSASLSAYGAHNPGSFIETTFISEDTILLLPEKSYRGTHTYKKHSCPFDALNLKLSMVEKILRSSLGRKALQNQLIVYLEANTKASIALKFPIELERDVRVSAWTFKDGIIKWTRRSITERVGFDVVARLESQRLMLVSIKKFQPFELLGLDILKPNKSFSKLASLYMIKNEEALDLPVLKKKEGFVHFIRF